MSEGLFRKAAIDKVSSPEQLDLLMRVTSPVGWLALLTVGLLIFAAGVWSVLGSITESVEGKGTFFKGDRLYDVKATMGGRIESLDVRPGDAVSVGQSIAKLRYEEASAEQRAAAAQTVAATEGERIAANQDIANSEREIARLNDDHRRLMLERDELRRLVSIGSTTGPELTRKESEISENRRQVGAHQSTIQAARAKLGSLPARVKATEAGIRGSAVVTSSESGHVFKVIKSEGETVPTGERLILIERASGPDQPCGGDLHVLVYIPGSFATKVERGQPVRVSPVGVDKETYGYILGVVESVATEPTSTQDMTERLKNDQLVSQFQPGAGEAAYEARVCLTRDPANQLNPFKWSFKQGRAMDARERFTCSVSIEVEQKKPYTYIVPMIRSMTGG